MNEVIRMLIVGYDDEGERIFKEDIVSFQAEKDKRENGYFLVGRKLEEDTYKFEQMKVVVRFKEPTGNIKDINYIFDKVDVEYLGEVDEEYTLAQYKFYSKAINVKME